ncbi:MAG: hypothetical protein KatS3mg049_4161 [Caldilinea sp.]|nr:MAG: hypothetical protein KatS3mg049_4161 [Caldilinea sp.]
MGCIGSHFQEGGSHAGLGGWLNVLLITKDNDAVEVFVIYNDQAAWVSGQLPHRKARSLFEIPTSLW